MPRPVGKNALRAWELMLRAQALSMRAVDRDLQAKGLPPLDACSVLLELFRAPGKRLKHAALAEAVALTRSGLTRQVAKLEAQDLVRREDCDEDGRCKYAVLTEAGESLCRRAWPEYAKGIALRFGRHLSRPEVGQLDAALTKVLAALKEDES